MLTLKQVHEIREHLEKAQNPIFFFDNDQDGLCSFLLLSRFIGRGRGIPVKSFPEMDASYFQKVEDFKADYVFILDKPLVSNNFFKDLEKFNLPVVWIDHHEIQFSEKMPSFVHYYNPLYNSEKTNEPVTALCYQVANKKDDLWLAIVGCISDKFLPEVYSDFQTKFPELSFNSKNAFDVFYNSEIGKIARMLGFALKDSMTNVVNMIKFLLKVNSPYDILEANSKNKTIHERFEYIETRYRKLLTKALELSSKENLLFFEYGGDLSISGDLSNELSYRLPDKKVVVVYIKGAKANVSCRGKKVRQLLLKAIEGIEGAHGGGHEDAVGAQLRVEDIEKFRKNLLSL